MAILRQSPGEIAFSSGTYALVGHYGEPTGFAVGVKQGDRLPLVAVATRNGPLWFVLVVDCNEASQAA
jgi:hypothetical protein